MTGKREFDFNVATPDAHYTHRYRLGGFANAQVRKYYIVDAANCHEATKLLQLLIHF